MPKTIVLLKQAYSDPSTLAVYPDAVWFPQHLDQDNKAERAGLTWDCYFNQATFLAGASRVGQHMTPVDPATFEAGAAQVVTAGETRAQAAAEQYVFLAKTVRDTPGTNPDGTPLLGPDGQRVMVAFFKDAQVVTVQVP